MGYDLSNALWRNDGWREMAQLRRKLENLKELRDLVRALGRASGKGPKRRAPQEVGGVTPQPLVPETLKPRQENLRNVSPTPRHAVAAEALCIANVPSLQIAPAPITSNTRASYGPSGAPYIAFACHPREAAGLCLPQLHEGRLRSHMWCVYTLTRSRRGRSGGAWCARRCSRRRRPG